MSDFTWFICKLEKMFYNYYYIGESLLLKRFDVTKSRRNSSYQKIAISGRYLYVKTLLNLNVQNNGQLKK